MNTPNPYTKRKRDGNVSDGSAVRKRGRPLALLLHTLLGLVSLSVAQAGFDLGSGGFDLGNSTNYQILYSGLGNKLDFQDSRVIGNIGIGGPAGQVNAYVQLNPNSYLTNAGNIDFSGKASVQGGPPVNIGAITGGVSAVQADLDYLSKLSAALGAESGADLVIKINNGETQTINVSDGKDDGNGNRIFTIQKAGDFVFNNGSTLQLVGTKPTDKVVFNFVEGGIYQFNGNILFNNELESDQVLWNFYTDPSSKKSKDVSIQNSSFTPDLNANPLEGAQGVFLSPDGVMSMNNSTLCGRFFGGGGMDGNTFANMDINKSAIETCVVAPEPSTYVLLGMGALVLILVHRRRRA